MKFSDIPGHEEVKAHLRQLVDDDRLPHALLLEGPEGTAKFALARATAQYLHCENRHDGDSCGMCPSCLQHQALNHIDTVLSFPVVKRGSGKVTVSNDWLAEFRSFITKSPWMDMEDWQAELGNPNTKPAIYVDEGAELVRRLSYTAHASRYKVVLMWLPERMQTEAANKLLKLIEEPFADTKFIMCSDNARQLLPTIYSRVQRVRVLRYGDNVTASWLMGKGVDRTAAMDAAVLSEGNLYRALRLAQSHTAGGDRWFDEFVQLMRLAYQKKVGMLKVWATKLGAEKREPLMNFMDYACRMLRENFVYNLGRPELNVQTAAESDFSVRFARFINERNVLQLIDAFTKAKNDIAANANSKIVLFDVAITVVLLIRK